MCVKICSEHARHDKTENNVRATRCSLQKVGTTRLRGVAGRKRSVGCLDEDETKIRGSMLGETAESPPRERRSSPCPSRWWHYCASDNLL